MNETLILNVVLATVPAMIVILIGILVNNVRLNDLRDSLRAETRVVEEWITGTRDVLRAEMEKNQSEMLHRFGDLDTRMSRIENSLGMNRG
jgi:hypothetical protein